MSAIERSFCRSAVWRPVSVRALRWALHGHHLTGDILEIGSGTGTMAAELHKSYPAVRLTATDIDPIMVSDARRRLPDSVAVQEADATALPFDDGSFDTVVSFLMLHHIVDWEAAVAEISRVLRPGGLLLGYDLVRTTATATVHRLDGSPFRLLTATELTERATEVGLSAVHTEPALAGQGMRFAAHRN